MDVQVLSSVVRVPLLSIHSDSSFYRRSWDGCRLAVGEWLHSLVPEGNGD